MAKLLKPVLNLGWLFRRTVLEKVNYQPRHRRPATVNQIQNKAHPTLWALSDVLWSIVTDCINMQRLKDPEWQKTKTYGTNNFPKK